MPRLYLGKQKFAREVKELKTFAGELATKKGGKSVIDGNSSGVSGIVYPHFKLLDEVNQFGQLNEN